MKLHKHIAIFEMPSEVIKFLINRGSLFSQTHISSQMGRGGRDTEGERRRGEGKETELKEK